MVAATSEGFWLVRRSAHSNSLLHKIPAAQSFKDRMEADWLEQPSDQPQQVFAFNNNTYRAKAKVDALRVGWQIWD